jgi:hypothetical protein
MNEGSVTVNQDGRTYRGWYTIEGGLMTVSNGEDAKTAQLGNMPPATLARMLLGELIREEAAREARGE